MLKKLGYATLIAFGGLAALALVWWLIAAITGLMWEQAGYSVWRSYEVGMSPMSRSGQVFSLIWVAICFGVAAFTSYDEDENSLPGVLITVTAVVACVSFILMAMPAGFVTGTDSKLEAAPFVRSVSIEYADKDAPPRILARLLEGGHDVGPAKIVAGKPTNYLASGFEERPASLAGAQRIMSERATGSSKADILDDTYAYISDREGKGKWTAIRDGEGKRIHIDSIVEWNGDAEKVHQCRFEGKNRLDAAITGEYANSLSDRIREQVSANVYWGLSDVYGYCDTHDNPVIVIPVKTDRWNGSRSIEVPAGVIVVRGSESGSPAIEYKRSVKSGEIPGPVYPISVATKQREMVNWAAGRKWYSNDAFGFEPVNIDANAENPADYNLRSQEDGRMYFVTPLTAKGTRSQVIQAVSFVPSDTVTYGQLNTIRVQVHGDEDGNALTEQDLERRARDILRKLDPAFLNEGQKGRLEEFIPGEDGNWVVFATQSGQPRYLLRIRPGQLDQAVELNGGEIGRVLIDGTEDELAVPGETPTPGESDEELSALTDAELQAQIDATIDELSQLSAEERSRRTASASGN